MAYPAKYHKSFPDRLIEFMRQGYSFRAFGAEVGATRTALYKWVEKYPKFRKAKEYAENLALYYYEKRMLAKTGGRPVDNFDPKLCDGKLIAFTLSTRFHEIYGRKDKVDLSNEDGTITPSVVVLPSNGREKK